MRKRYVIPAGVAIAVVALAFAAVVWIVPRNSFLSTVFESFLPGLVPASSYVDNLKSKVPDLVRESLGYLDSRKDPAGIPDALLLLKSKDDYIWLNAALYTGGCGRQEAVPYLIKGLRHTAWRADPDILAALTTLTGQNFGNDFTKWQAWWIGQHPGASFDWTSHLGFSPRVPAAELNQ